MTTEGCELNHGLHWPTSGGLYGEHGDSSTGEGSHHKYQVGAHETDTWKISGDRGSCSMRTKQERCMRDSAAMPEKVMLAETQIIMKKLLFALLTDKLLYSMHRTTAQKPHTN